MFGIAYILNNMIDTEEVLAAKVFRTYGTENSATGMDSPTNSSDNALKHPGLSVERARVISVEVGERNTSLWVETFQSSTCGSCEAKKGCGQGVLNRWFQRGSQCFEVSCAENQADFFTVGQWVEIGIPDGLVLKASLVAYLLPLFGLIFGAIVLESFYPGDLAALFGGILGFAIGLVVVRQFAERRQTLRDSQPQLIGKIQSNL